jgi:DNA-binding XRE family transcriptional regulator
MANNSYDVKKIQAEAMAKLQADLAEAEAKAEKENKPWHAQQAQFIRQLVYKRLDEGLSQSELAAKLGMQQPAIARIEAGRGNPSLRTLLAIAKALNANLMVD